GQLAGATGAATTSLAVDALRGVVWAALRAELPDSDPELLSQLAERLSQVTELIRVAGLTYGDAPGLGAGGGQSPALSAVDTPEQPRWAPNPHRTAESPRPEPPAEQAFSAAEGAFAPKPVAAEAPPQEPTGQEARSEPEARIVPPPRAPEPEPPRWVWGAIEPGSPEAEALWVEALAEEIQRTRDAPLSLLLAELEDAERVLTVEPEARAAGAFGAFARAVRGVVRRQDILVCETESRAWIIARDTGRGGAQALGSRIAGAVRAGEPWRGAPLAASVGISVLGEDGRTPAELIEAAEEARFAAAAMGVDVLRSAREAPPGD
ncbi:MAG: hypothetical protein WCB67_03230, partial [Solirubrobacteraceae bacterium]